MAIELKNLDAIGNLAYIYQFNSECKNIQKAIKYYKMEIEFKDTTAMNNLAYIYEQCDGCQNIQEAF